MDEGDIAVECGDSANYINVDKKGSDSKERAGTRNDDDVLEENDDDENDEMDEEDGVIASRTQSENYGEDDASEENSDCDTDTDANAITDDDQSTSPSFLVDLVKIDVKHNIIQLQPLRVDPSSRPLLMIGLVDEAAS